MKYSKQAKAYIDSEHIRFLGDGNQVPTLEERVMAAFDAGMAKATKTYSNLDLIAKDKCNINFPNWNE